MVACSAELLGIQSCAADLGLPYDGVVYADAIAALGIVQRRGIGKVRHIRTQSLWLQEAHATKRLAFEKMYGWRNPSDLMTKPLTDTLQQRYLEHMSTHVVSGRAESALSPEQHQERSRPILPRHHPGGVLSERTDEAAGRDSQAKECRLFTSRFHVLYLPVFRSI